MIQGIGYPNPNRSHFRSTEIWQTASDSEKFERYGWLGRYFDNACAGADPTVGINIGRQMPQAFAARHPMGVSLENPESYRFISSEKGKRNEMTASEESYRKLNQSDETWDDGGRGDANSGGSIGSISGTVHHTGSALDFLERTAMDAQISSDKIRAISSRVENKANYPQSQLGTSLEDGGPLDWREFADKGVLCFAGRIRYPHEPAPGTSKVVEGSG